MIDQDLPPEIIDNILSFLPLKDLCNTQETSKVFHVLSDAAQTKKDMMIKKIRKFRNDNKRGLRWAAKIGNKELVNFFIEKSSLDEVITVKGSRDQNLIMFFNDKHLPNRKVKIVKDSVMNWGMEGAVRGGHMDLVKFFIEKGANNWDMALYFAAQGGHTDLVEFFIEKGADNWDGGMYGAAKGGHKNLVDFFIEKGANNWDMGLYFAARGGHRDLVDLFIVMQDNQDGNSYFSMVDWNDGMYAAARGGYMDLVKFFIEKGANNWEMGLYFAAQGGHKNLVDFFIEKGVKDWKGGLYSAAKGGHKHLVDFFIEKRANEPSPGPDHIEGYWYKGMQGAAQGGHKDLIDFFIEKITNLLRALPSGRGPPEDPDGRSFAALCWNGGMEGAVRGGHMDLVKFFIEKGANNWDLGIEAAAMSGHYDLVQFFRNLKNAQVREKREEIIN